ncbi:MAG: trehalose-phosphatase, partial [Endomicrobiales bacterium]
PAKKVREVRPPVDWNKGSAVRWLLKKLPPSHRGAYPLYLGDDVADEDVFKVLGARGLTVLVGKPRPSHADYYLKDPHEVFLFLKELEKVARLRQ